MNAVGNTRLQDDDDDEFSDEDRHLVVIASEPLNVFLAPIRHMVEDCLLCVDEQDTQYVVGRLDNGEPFALEAENPVQL